MSPIRWHHHPELHRPVLVTAFEGWNDAGDAASGAARWLIHRHGAERVATLESEEFFDFTTTRPLVEQTDTGHRRIVWPDTELWTATTSTDRDLAVLVGHEPHLRWRTWSAAVVELARALDVSMVITLGALLSDIPHTRPTVVTGTADDPEVAAGLGLVRSTYEGPTGIVGVLGAALRDAALPTVSLWASVPTYVSGAPSPKATLALVERTARVLGVNLPTTDLEIAAASYVRQLDELVAADEDTAEYVSGLEAAADDQPRTGFDDLDDLDEGNDLADLDPLDPLDADPAELVEEVERFLRGD